MTAAETRFDGPASLFFLLELAAWDAAFDRAEELASRRFFLGRMRGMFGLWDPQHAAFRRDSRFALVAGQLGLLEHWRTNGPPDRCVFEGETLVCDQA